MAGVASSAWDQPTGGEDGGEIKNCFSGSGGAKWERPICKDWKDKRTPICIAIQYVF